jgi:PIN domain nuclease of toxin-antitoxin system
VETVHLDTHIVLWLFQKELGRLSEAAVALIEANDLAVSAMVKMELELLYEIGRTPYTPDEILGNLNRTIGLRADESSMVDVVNHALGMHWTRDPFDRFIAANAALYDVKLITKDRTILEHCEYAVW